VHVDISFLPGLAAAFLLVFARIGTMLMLLPGLGEQNVSARMRLTVALVLAGVLLPLHRSAYHIDPGELGPAVVMLVEEILIGGVLGLTARLTVSALEVAGSVIAQQLGLGFVTAVDPTQGEQGMIVGNFLTMLGVTLLFATDMHHLVIAALNDSYTLFEPGELPATGDIAALITRTVAGAFRIEVQLSAPFIVFGLLFNIGLGVLARLMPQMQVFFVALPLSILLGLILLVLVVGAMMGVFLDYAGGVLHALALLWPERDRLRGLVGVDPTLILPFTRSLALHMLGAVVAILAIVAAADYLFQYRQWYERHKMSLRELKEEFRQTEGDPTVKGKLRQLRQTRMRKRMMAAVPTASVVITNPTHFAVALKYERGMNAPVCVAEGGDLIARKIRDVAREHDIPVVENPPLARALHGTVEIDQEIPPEHYRAVAEIIGYIMRLRRAVGTASPL